MMSLEEAKKDFIRMGKELEKFHRENECCAQCYKWLPKNYKWLKYRTGANLCSEECYKKFDEQVKEYQKSAKEMEEKIKRIEYEHRHSLKPFFQYLTVPVYGLRKDMEKFEKEIPNLLKKYNLGGDQDETR